MTIRTRNTLMKWLFIFSIAVIAALLTCFIVAFVSDSITPPEDIRLPFFMTYIPLARYHFSAMMFSVTVLILYVPATLLVMLRFFENTQTTEIVFFSTALIGFLCEGARFLIPLFGLWLSYSQLLLFVGRITFVGRLIVPLGFFCAALFSDADQRQDVERNATIALAVALVFAITIPLNTAQITSAGTIVPGFAAAFIAARVLIVLLTAVSFYLNAKKHDSPELRRNTLSFIMLILGYAFLIVADNFLFMGIGTVLLCGGTLGFLKNLHRLYLWK